MAKTLDQLKTEVAAQIKNVTGLKAALEKQAGANETAVAELNTELNSKNDELATAATLSSEMDTKIGELKEQAEKAAEIAGKQSDKIIELEEQLEVAGAEPKEETGKSQFIAIGGGVEALQLRGDCGLVYYKGAIAFVPKLEVHEGRIR